MYKYIYIYICLYIYLLIYVFIYLYIYVYTYTYIHIYVYRYTINVLSTDINLYPFLISILSRFTPSCTSNLLRWSGPFTPDFAKENQSQRRRRWGSQMTGTIQKPWGLLKIRGMGSTVHLFNNWECSTWKPSRCPVLAIMRSVWMRATRIGSESLVLWLKRCPGKHGRNTRRNMAGAGSFGTAPDSRWCWLCSKEKKAGTKQS